MPDELTSGLRIIRRAKDVEAAKDAVVEAARVMCNHWLQLPEDVLRAKEWSLIDALEKLDALTLPPPEHDQTRPLADEAMRRGIAEAGNGFHE